MNLGLAAFQFRDAFHNSLGGLMEVALGIDELNWYGRSIVKQVMPIRELMHEKCVTNYCSDYQFADFVIHVGERNQWGATVKLHKRAGSIGCHLYLDIPLDPPPDLVSLRIVSELRRGMTDIVDHMKKKQLEFDSLAFVCECEQVTSEIELRIRSQTTG